MNIWHILNDYFLHLLKWLYTLSPFTGSCEKWCVIGMLQILASNSLHPFFFSLGMQRRYATGHPCCQVAHVTETRPMDWVVCTTSRPGLIQSPTCYQPSVFLFHSLMCLSVGSWKAVTKDGRAVSTLKMGVVSAIKMGGSWVSQSSYGGKSTDLDFSWVESKLLLCESVYILEFIMTICWP